MLKGYKTKIIIVATILYAIAGLIIGKMDANTGIAMILAAVGAYGVYDKIERSTK